MNKIKGKRLQLFRKKVVLTKWLTLWCFVWGQFVVVCFGCDYCSQILQKEPRDAVEQMGDVVQSNSCPSQAIE